MLRLKWLTQRTKVDSVIVIESKTLYKPLHPKLTHLPHIQECGCLGKQIIEI